MSESEQRPQRRKQPARYIDVRKLKPYAQNARTHSREQVEQVKASIRRFGFVGVLAYDEHGLAIGHCRQTALIEMWDGGEEVYGPGKRELLPEGLAPAIDITGLSEEERSALIIADNQLALNAGWDEDVLAGEVRRLLEADFELPVIGFDDEYLNRLVHGPRDDDEAAEETPDVPDDPVTLRGDIWLLGNHRIICGDSTDAQTVAAVLMDERPHLMVTDPPYGVNYDPKWRNEALESWKAPRATGTVDNDDEADWTEAWRLFEGDVAYVWHAGTKALTVEQSLRACDFAIRSQIIWVKQHFVIGRGDYHPQHEPLFYAVRKGRTGHYVGGRKQSTVWEIKNLSAMGGGHDDMTTGHGTQKPVECMRRPIENNSKIGEAIYEPFSGSGTTIIACEQTNRRCFAIELNPAYVDVAVRRWEQFTGRKAVLLETGGSFGDTAVERADQQADDLGLANDSEMA